MGAEGMCEKSQCHQGPGWVPGTGQSQLGKSLGGAVGQAVRSARAGSAPSCTAYFLCNLGTPLRLPGPQFPHLSHGVGSKTFHGLCELRWTEFLLDGEPSGPPD